MKLKKVLAAILAVAMLLSLANIAVLAEDETVFDAAIGDNYYENIADAIKAAQDGDTVVLLHDTSCETYMFVKKNLTVDLGGHTLNGFFIIYGGNFVLKNGEITHSNPIYVYGTDDDSTVSFTLAPDAKISADYGICIFNKNSAYIGKCNNVTVNIYGDIEATSGIFVQGNILATTDGGDAVYAEQAIANKTYPVINIYEGAEIIAASNSGDSQGISINGFGEVNVYGGTISGREAIGVKRGILNIFGGTLIATGDKLDPIAGVNSGTDPSGAAVSLTGTYNNSVGVISVNINGGTLTSNNYCAVYMGHSVDSNNNEIAYQHGVNLSISGGTFNGAIGEDALVIKEKLASDYMYTYDIKGGTFSHNPSTYVAKGYYAADNGDGTYTVKEGEATVIETAKSTGATITLNDLADQSNVKLDEDATYKVVVSTAPTADVAAANEAIKNNGADTNTEKAIFDISVMKTDSNGTVKDVSGDITNQTVTLTLAETPADAASVHVYHVDGTTSAVSEINSITVSGNTVSFTAPSFSTYAVTYTPATVSENDITDKIGVVFSPVAAGSNQYYITLKSFDGKKIYRYMSADIAFKNNCATVGYDIEPAANMTASVASVNGNSTEYHFEMDGTRQSSATSNDGITIGTITFYGYGKLDFSVDKAYTSNHAINIVNTAEAVDNIVANYTIGGATKELIVNELKASSATYVSYYAEDENGTITDTLSAETKNLTINVKFNNIISDNAATYQDMKVTVSGGDLTSPIVKNFGSEGGIALKGDTYTVEIADTLTKNVGYTVKVEGAGYRTARHTVTMTENKVLNFWNNVKDSANATVIETGKTAMTKNFLAGDIVKDNNINIYDLSAVVSYFGTENLVSAHPEYAKYDLNRDGVIDSKDVAYVLVSWGE